MADTDAKDIDAQTKKAADELAAVKAASTTPAPVKDALAPAPAESPVIPAGSPLAAKTATPSVLAPKTATPAVVTETPAPVPTEEPKTDVVADTKATLASAKADLDKKIEDNQARIDKILAEGKAQETQLAEETKTAQGYLPKAQSLDYKPPKPTSLPEQWGSFAMIFAMLGSMFTRNHATTALNAAAAAMNGFKQGDKEAAELAYKNWQTASENMRKSQEYQNKHYDEIMKNIRERRAEGKAIRQEELTAARAEMTAAATSFRDDVMVTALNDRTLNQAQTTARLRDLALLQAEQAQLKIDKARKDAAADAKFQEDVATVAAMDPENQAIYVAASGSPKAAAWYAKASTQRALLAGKTEQIRNSDEYKKADEIGKLTLLADADDPTATKELDKLVAKQATQKLDGSTDAEAQRSNDEAIANYSSPPPPQSARNKVAQKLYEDTMARVRKINKSYDPGTYGNAVKIRRNWQDASNKSGGQIQTYNTITHHLSYLDDLVDALETGDQATINRVAKTTAAAIGNPNLAVTDVQAARRVIADEITKGVIGSQGALLDRDKMDELFDPTQPLSVFKRNIGVLKNLVGGRFAAAQKSFESGAKQSKEEFWNLLEDDTKRSFGEQLGIPKKDIPAKPDTANNDGFTNVTPAATPAATPSATPAATPAATKDVGPADFETAAEYIAHARAEGVTIKDYSDQVLTDYWNQKVGKK